MWGRFASTETPAKGVVPQLLWRRTESDQGRWAYEHWLFTVLQELHNCSWDIRTLVPTTRRMKLNLPIECAVVHLCERMLHRALDEALSCLRHRATGQFQESQLQHEKSGSTLGVVSSDLGIIVEISVVTKGGADSAFKVGAVAQKLGSGATVATHGFMPACGTKPATIRVILFFVFHSICKTQTTDEDSKLGQGCHALICSSYECSEHACKLLKMPRVACRDKRIDLTSLTP